MIRLPHGPAGLTIEFIQGEGMRHRIDRVDRKPIFAGRHLSELFFTWNGAGEAHDGIARRHAKAQREGEGCGIARIERHRTGNPVSIAQCRAQQPRADPLIAV